MTSRRLLLAGALTLALLAPMSAAFAADIGLSPARLNLLVPPGGTASAEVTVFSTAAAAVPLSISTADWVQDGEGKLSFVPAGSTPYSASPWLVPSATSLSVPANGQVTTRVTVEAPDDPSLAGTYQSVVFFETSPTAPTGPGTHMATRQRLGLVIYVTITGTETTGASLDDMYLQDHQVALVVGNTGNTLMRASGSVEVRDATGSTVATLAVNDEPILRESQRTVSLPLPDDLAPGFYVALAVIDDSRGGSVVGQLPFQNGE